MKLTLALIASFVASIGISNAATITVTNFVNPDVSAILNAGGVATSGVVVLGTYSLEPTTADGYLTGLTQLGSLQFGTTYGGPLDGFVSGDINAALPLGSPVIGQQVYVIVGNGASLETSTDVLVWKPTSNPAGNTYTADNPVGGPDNIQFLGTLGTTVIGSYGTQANIGLGDQASFVMAAIPEPSVALLGAFGVLGLLRRRR